MLYINQTMLPTKDTCQQPGTSRIANSMLTRLTIAAIQERYSISFELIVGVVHGDYSLLYFGGGDKLSY